jgi:hypothetical protein
VNRPTLDRLAELETLAPEEDCPADARFSVPASDLRDLLALIPIVLAAEALRNSLDADEQEDLSEKVCEAFEAYDQVRPEEWQLHHGR